MQRLWFVLLLAVASNSGAQTLTRQNLAAILGFENGTPGQFPAGWGGSVGAAFIDDQVFHSGLYSCRIERTAATSGTFSTITATIPLDFIGQTITWRGWVKTQNVSDSVAIWIREDGVTPSLAFSTSQGLGVNGTTDWTQYSISIPVVSAATQVVFGFLVNGTGDGWVDDLEMLADGVPVAQAPGISVVPKPGWFDPPNPNPLLPTGQTITPAGATVTFPGRPAAVAIDPVSPTAAFLAGESDSSPAQTCVSGSTPASIILVDLTLNAVKQCYAPKGDYAAGFTGLLYNAAGTQLYASLQDGLVAIMPVLSDGTIDVSVPATMVPVQGGCPGGLALSDDQKTLYVALNCKNQIAAIDVASGQLNGKVFSTGNAPWGIVINGNTACVTNEGGDPPSSSAPACTVSPQIPCYNLSHGQRIVADPLSGASVSGSVSVIDLSGQSQAYSIQVGLHPTAMLFDPPNSQLFVANTSGDSISVIDTNAGMVVNSIPVTPFPGAPFGSSPNALAMSSGYLVVSLARNNALEVFSQSWSSDAVPQRIWTPAGLIPTAWFPAGLAFFSTSAGTGLVVANDKGLGSLGLHPGTGFWVYSQIGTASVLSPFTPPTADSLNQLAVNNNWTQLLNGVPWLTPNPQPEPVAVPLLTGDSSSLIQHVFLIIKENRTYDQVLGDDPKGNGDASLVQFGGNVALQPNQPAVCTGAAASCVTPNHHAIADQFVLLDNFYAAGNVSADGHQWLTQAYALDYIERLFGTGTTTNYRSYPFDGGDSLAYTPTGFLWQNALANGASVKVYGEFAATTNAPGSLTCSQWMHDSGLLINGQTSGLNYPLGNMKTQSDVPSLNPLLDPDYPGFVLTVPDQYRAALFLRDLSTYANNLNNPGAPQLPNLVILDLPDDHTGSVPATISVSAQVSDNDYALGQIVQGISQSPFWSNSAIFVVEDDAQNGTDHVDGHRTVALVASPYAVRGVTDSTHYSQIDMVRTIEQILGLPPMNQMDLAAQPMYSSFTNTPDFTPFLATSPQIPTCGGAAPADRKFSAVRKAWLNALKKMDFSRPDAADENLLNRFIWYETKGYGKPYPGDPKVLRPKDVQKDDDDR